MLKKLLKYEFKVSAKQILPIFLISLILSFANRIISYIAENISVLEIPSTLIKVFTVLVIIGLPIVTFAILIMRFYSNLIKDEGYLTHTLPVKKSSIVLSKLIVSCVLMFLAIIVSIGTIFIGFEIKNEIIKEIFDLLKEVDLLFMILISISLIGSLIMYFLVIYASIALGQKHNNKIIYSVIYGVVLYNINQILSTVFMLIPRLFSKNYFEIFDDETASIAQVNGLLIYALGISIIFIIGYFVLTTKTLEKKLNLD